MKLETRHGVITVLLAALLMLLAMLFVQRCAGAVFPIKISATNERQLVDQNDDPFFIFGDAGWGTCVNISHEEGYRYLTNRAAHGVNAIVVRLIEAKFQGASYNLHAKTPPENYYDEQPFTTTDLLNTPNTNYFDRAKWFIECARTNGILVFVCPMYLGYYPSPDPPEGWYERVITNDTSTLSGTNNCYAYGQFIGNHFKDQENIIWVHSGDRNPQDAEDEIDRFVDGLLEYDTNHLSTAHCTAYSSLQFNSKSWLDVDAVYASLGLYVRAQLAYDTTPTRPVFHLESYYENEHAGDADPPDLRRQSWYAVAGGAYNGFFFGNSPIWYTGNDGALGDWTNHFETTSHLLMTNVVNYMTNRDWGSLNPDSENNWVTAGYGTYNKNVIDYKPTSYSMSSNFMFTYMPTGGTVTVDLSKFTNDYVWARWYNPTTGVYTTISTNASAGSQNFTSPDATDWVLSIEGLEAGEETGYWYVDVDQTGSGNNNGTSWANAWTNLEAVLEGSNNVFTAGDTIWISGGTYTGEISWNIQKGTAASPITLKASQEAGHNDLVLLNGRLSFGGGDNYVILDGAMDDTYAETYMTNTPNVLLITNNIGFKIDSSTVGPPANSGITVSGGSSGIGMQFKWLDITSGTNNPAPNNGHGISIKDGATNSSIAYCYIHHTFEDGINCDNNSYGNYWGQVEIHHCWFKNTGDDGIQGDLGWDVNHCILHDTLNLAGHPDVIQAPGVKIRFWNNIAYNWNTLLVYATQDETNAGQWHIYGNMLYWTTNGTRSQESGIWAAGTESQAPSNGLMTVTNVLVLNNTVICGTATNAIQDGIGVVNGKRPDLVVHITNLIAYNNLIVDAATWSGKWRGNGLSNVWYLEDDLIFDYNCCTSTNGTGNNIEYGGVLYDDAIALNAATAYGANTTNRPTFVDYDNHDFRLSTNDTACIDQGTNLLSITNYEGGLPGIETDLWGYPRGVGGGWDIGASESQGAQPSTNKLLCWIKFEDDFSDGQLDDSSEFGAHVLNFGWTNTGTNLYMNWPSNVSGKVDTFAGAFQPNYSNSNLPGYDPDFHDGDYGAITNVGDIIQMTQATFMVWCYFSNYPVAKTDDHQATFFDSGYGTNGGWRFGRDESSTWGNPRFSFVTNWHPISFDASFKLSYPTNLSGVDWTTFGSSNWTHYAASVDCSDDEAVVVRLYLNGVEVTNGTYVCTETTNKVGYLTVTDDGSASWTPWLGVGVWSHNTGTKKPPLNDGDGQPNTGWMHGAMDNIRIYNDVLSDAEILAIYNSEAGEAEPPVATNLIKTAIQGRVNISGRVVPQ